MKESQPADIKTDSFLQLLHHMNLQFNEDPELPLNPNFESLENAQTRGNYIKTSIAKYPPNSYEYTYLSSLLAGQQGIIRYIENVIMDRRDP